MLEREMLSESEYLNAKCLSVCPERVSMLEGEMLECLMLRLHRYIYTQKIVYSLAFEKGIPETTRSALNWF